MGRTKIAVISDLHASLHMLKGFMKYIKEEEITKVLNLGDFISHGPNPCEVIDYIMEDKRFINIKGYDEESLFNETKENEEIGMGRWLKDKLGEERLEKLKNLPSVRTINLYNMRILMVHNNGWAEINQKFSHAEASRIKKEQYDYICVGGSHIQEFYNIDEKYMDGKVIKPGALAGKEKKQGYFAIIEMTETEPEIMFRNIKLLGNFNEKVNEDKELETLIEETNLEQRELIKNTLLHIYNTKHGFADQQTIDSEIIDKIFSIGIRECKYICIGCWQHESSIIREILFYIKCRAIKTNEKTGQQWYIGEVNDEVKELILHKRYNNDQQIKWFEVSFQDSLHSVRPIYGVYHYGKECVIRRATNSQISDLQNLLKLKNVQYKISDVE